MSTSLNHTKAFVQCCHGKHTVASSRTLLLMFHFAVITRQRVYSSFSSSFSSSATVSQSNVDFGFQYSFSPFPKVSEHPTIAQPVFYSHYIYVPFHFISPSSMDLANLKHLYCFRIYLSQWHAFLEYKQTVYFRNTIIRYKPTKCTFSKIIF